MAQQSVQDRLRRWARLGDLVAIAGVLGFTGCLLARFTTALPRWDLLAMLGVIAAGGALRTYATHAAVRLASDPALRPRPEAPREPPGFRAEQRLWWPHRKHGASMAFLWLCAVPVCLLALSTGQTPGVLERVRSADHTIAEVWVESAERAGSPPGPYEVVANTRADGTGQALRGSIRRVDSPYMLWTDSRVWAMYVPDPSPASSGRPVEAVMAMDRDTLLDWAGGWTSGWGHLASAVMPALVFLHIRRRLRKGKLDGRGQDPVGLATHIGRARALRVRVTGARPATINRGRVLVLSTLEGERELLLDRWSDPDHVARTLAGHNGWLYWALTVRDRYVIARSTPVKVWRFLTLAFLRANIGAAALDSAVLVLADGRYLRGRTPCTVFKMPAGQWVPRRHPGDCPEAQPLEPHFLRTPRVRPLAVLLALPGLLTLLALTAVPFGDLTTSWQLNTFLPWLVVMASAYASYRAATYGGARR